ncbi:MAG TPA: formate/nitrite transporter family protein [Thermoanaerobaculia bacterium]|jgi:formate/nitrite transporter FocA (FNT family)|nr:formate/nitrite transporter family protein [Thermoanaerobaculia bacterium]
MADDLQEDPSARRSRNKEDEKGQEPQKSYETILEQEIAAGLTELERPAMALLLSGLSAGLDVSLSLLLMAVVHTLTDGVLSKPVSEILVALTYASGFLFVVLGRSELFTEHTTLAVLPVLDRRASPVQLGRLWGLVYIANQAGAAAFAAFLVFLGPRLGVIEPRVFGEIASGLVEHPGWVILLSGVLAGWLMGLLSWLVAASRDTIGQIFIVLLVTTAIGLCHLHHAVVGTAEVLAGVFSGQGATLADFGKFLLWATLGNMLGGFFFVALIKFGHIRSSSE